ncbi:hypothetical protein LBMAG47_29180 [Planctomycetia bacterium]|nr:hypothetical protein LBMAG47_29180 [Planctomycetia bacterium]
MGLDDMSGSRRFSDAKRWADIVVHRGVAHWVKVAEDPAARGGNPLPLGLEVPHPRGLGGGDGSPAEESHGFIGTCRYIG